MRGGRYLVVGMLLGLWLSMAGGAEAQPQGHRSPRGQDDTVMEARMLAELEILRDLELLRQLDVLRKLDEVRTELPPRPAGTTEKGKP